MNNVQLPAKLFKVILWTSIWDKHFRATLKFVEYFFTSTLIGHLRVLDRVKFWILITNLGSPFSVSRTKILVKILENSYTMLTWCEAWVDIWWLLYAGAMACIGWDKLWCLWWNDLSRDQGDHAWRLLVSSIGSSRCRIFQYRVSYWFCDIHNYRTQFFFVIKSPFELMILRC